VHASGQSLSSPRLASLGTEFVLAYGRHGTSGGQAAVVRVTPQTGAVGGTPVAGTTMTAATVAPEIDAMAVDGGATEIAVISRPPGLAAQPATIDAFTSIPALAQSRAPVTFSGSRSAGIGWVPGRFIAGAVTGATSGGGTLLELTDDTNLTAGAGYPFTSAGDSPIAGASGATISIAGAGDRVAVAWIDSQTGTREVRIAVLSLNDRAVLNAVQASTESSTTKSYPHVVYDGAAFVLAWVEGDVQQSSRIKLARFDANLAAVTAAPMNVGAAGVVTLADIDVAAAGANATGIAAAGSGVTQLMYTVTCN
jgi:hypothetical protein